MSAPRFIRRDLDRISAARRWAGPRSATVVVDPLLSDGGVVLALDGPLRQVVKVGVNDAHATAKLIVRTGLADVLAWLKDPPSMATGQEMLIAIRGYGGTR